MTDDDEPLVPVNYRDTHPQIERLDAIAAREHRSRSQMIRVMVADYIERHTEGKDQC
jgi:hypothetical protein